MGGPHLEMELKTSDSTLSALAPAASVLRALPIGPREGVAGSSAASVTTSSVWLKARCGWAVSAVMTSCWRRLSAGLRARSVTAGRQQRALLCPLGYLQFGLSGFINITKSIGVFGLGFLNSSKKPVRVECVESSSQRSPRRTHRSCAVHPPLRPVRSAGKPHPAPDTALAILPLGAPTRSTSRLRPPEPHTRANAEKVGHVRLGRAALRETPRDGRCIVFHRQL